MIFFSERRAGACDFAIFFDAIPLSGKTRIREVFKLLGVTESTLKRYLSGAQEPPPAMVRLLFMESRYGADAVANHAHQGFLYERQHRQSLESEICRLQATIAALDAENDELRKRDNQPFPMAANGSSFYR